MLWRRDNANWPGSVSHWVAEGASCDSNIEDSFWFCGQNWNVEYKILVLERNIYKK